MTKENKDIINMEEITKASLEVTEIIKKYNVMEKILILQKLLMTYEYIEQKEIKMAEKVSMEMALQKIISDKQIKKDL